MENRGRDDRRLVETGCEGMNFRGQTPQEQAQWKEVFRMRLYVLLFFLLVFGLLSGLCLRGLLCAGVSDRHTEWSLQLGENSAQLLALAPEETGTGQIPRIDLKRLQSFLSLTVMGEESNPKITLRDSPNADKLELSDGSHVVKINGTPVFLQEKVVARDGKILVSVAFLKDYFEGLTVETHSKTGILRIARTAVPFAAKTV